MSAYVKSLNVLAENVRSELRQMEAVARCDTAETCPMCAAFRRMREQLDADVREVRADVEQIISEGQF